MGRKNGVGKLTRFFKWFVVLLIVASAGVLVWRQGRPKPVEVVVKTVSRGTVERTVSNTRAGTVKACRRAKLSPNIGGQIAKLPVREGDLVKEGELLVELWNQDLAARVRLAGHEVEVAWSRLKSVVSRSASAHRNAERLLKLKQSAAVAEDRVDTAVAEAEALKAEAEAARIQVQVSEANLALAKANYERTQLLAPFDGVIAEINGELFEYVTPSPVGIPTPPVIDIVSKGCFYVIAPIDEVDVSDVRKGMPARISLDAFGSRRYDGKVRRIADYVLDVEKQARTVDVEVEFDHPEDTRHLLAGYSADIEIILESRADVVRVPAEAVVEGHYVFVFDPAVNRLARREIKAGISNWDYMEIIGGLGPDDLVVVNIDKPGIKDGAPAKRLEEEQ